MAIAPIDLQAIFSQVDKVGRIQSSQQDGQALQQAIHGNIIQKRTVEHIQSVNEAQNTGEGTEKVKDRRSGSEGGEQAGGGKKEKSQKESGEKEKASVLQDPTLGKNIDISL